MYIHKILVHFSKVVRNLLYNKSAAYFFKVIWQLVYSKICYNFRGLTSEEAQLEYILITQQLEGYGDEYYPAKVCCYKKYL